MREELRNRWGCGCGADLHSTRYRKSFFPIELFEFFYVLRKNNWEGVWQLDQFPFREDSVEVANIAIDFLKSVDKALDDLDYDALAKAQSNQDAMSALKIAQKALYKHLSNN